MTSEEIKNYQIHQLALSAIINETIFENEFKFLSTTKNLKLDFGPIWPLTRPAGDFKARILKIAYFPPLD